MVFVVVKIFSVTEKIFLVTEKIFSMIEKIFSKVETIFPVSETVVSGIWKIFSVIEAISPVVETMSLCDGEHLIGLGQHFLRDGRASSPSLRPVVFGIPKILLESFKLGTLTGLHNGWFPKTQSPNAENR